MHTGSGRRTTRSKLGRNKIPITVTVGAPLRAAETVEQTDAALREAMTALLHAGAAVGYPHPGRRVLGAAAARRQRADAGRGQVLDEAELAERARKRPSKAGADHAMKLAVTCPR